MDNGLIFWVPVRTRPYRGLMLTRLALPCPLWGVVLVGSKGVGRRWVTQGSSTWRWLSRSSVSPDIKIRALLW